ncbi:hypothetical protein O8W32_07535 [Methanomassiliicoccales archaeon LGM-DZ1]|nr:hypothetical protein O8W32_07535 [Methanomassiliicoccales archaeon LGM-DZ1]
MIAGAVVVIAVIAAAAYVVLSGDDDSDDETAYDLTVTRLTVFGNADNDDDLDSDDVVFINKIVSGEAEWDSSANPYADADGNGVVDSKDADYLNAIISKDTAAAPKIFYADVNGRMASVSQPVSKLGADYWPTIDGIIAIGAQGLVTYVDSGIYNQLSSNALKYNTLTQSSVQNFGSGFGTGYDFETVVATGVDAMVCGSADIYFVGIENKFDDSTRIDMIRLPFWEGDRVDSAVITLAYLLNNDTYIAKAKEFLSFEDGITQTIENGLSGITEKATSLVIYIGSSTEKNLDVEIEARGCGSFEWSVMGGTDNLSSDINSSGALRSDSMYYQTDQDYVISKNPDYVFILGKAGFNRTASDSQASFDAGAAYLTTTDAYRNGHIWVSGSGVTSGTMQKVTALLLATMVYEDRFSGVDAHSYLQEFVDTFTLANAGVSSSDDGYYNVRESGEWIYKPTSS